MSLHYIHQVSQHTLETGIIKSIEQIYHQNPKEWIQQCTHEQLKRFFNCPWYDKKHQLTYDQLKQEMTR